MFFGGEIFFFYFESGYFNLLHMNPYFVTYRWKILLSKEIVMTRNGFNDIPGQNQLSNCHFGLGCHTHFKVALLFFSYPAIKQGAPQNELTINV